MTQTLRPIRNEIYSDLESDTGRDWVIQTLSLIRVEIDSVSEFDARIQIVVGLIHFKIIQEAALW